MIELSGLLKYFSKSGGDGDTPKPAPDSRAAEPKTETLISPEKLAGVAEICVVGDFPIELIIDSARPADCALNTDSTAPLHCYVQDGTLIISPTKVVDFDSELQFARKLTGKNVVSIGGVNQISGVHSAGTISIGSGFPNISAHNGSPRGSQIEVSSGSAIEAARIVDKSHASDPSVTIYLHLPEKKVRIYSRRLALDVTTPPVMSNEQKAEHIETVLIPKLQQKIEEKIAREKEKKDNEIRKRRQKASDLQKKAKEKKQKWELKAQNEEEKAAYKKADAELAMLQGKKEKAIDKSIQAQEATREAQGHRAMGNAEYEEYVKASETELEASRKLLNSTEMSSELQEKIAEIESEIAELRTRASGLRNPK